MQIDYLIHQIKHIQIKHDMRWKKSRKTVTAQFALQINQGQMHSNDVTSHFLCLESSSQHTSRTPITPHHSSFLSFLTSLSFRHSNWTNALENEWLNITTSHAFIHHNFKRNSSYHSQVPPLGFRRDRSWAWRWFRSWAVPHPRTLPSAEIIPF